MQLLSQIGESHGDDHIMACTDPAKYIPLENDAAKASQVFLREFASWCIK
jgi:hypothetical protein